MRTIREGVSETADLIEYYNGASKHRTLHKLTELSRDTYSTGFPVSGDDIARLTERTAP